MSFVFVKKDRYTADPVFQWDRNQKLVIHGLSLAFIPEIHFTNDAMSKAIVRQSTMDSKGIITVDIPNSILQKPSSFTAFVCGYEGNTFKTYYKIDIPMKRRQRPGDYTIEDSDGEIYSFNAIENYIENQIASLKKYVEVVKYTHPSTHPADMIMGLAAVATTGEYTDLLNTPTIHVGTSEPDASLGKDGDIYIMIPEVVE